jgi:two-component system response regulator
MSEARPVLLVEDNAMDEELTLRALKKSDIARSVHVVRDGAEALDYLFARGAHASRAGAPLPEVVLLDLKLPKLDGHEVLRAIRGDERTRLLPVVLLSSSVEDRDRAQSYALGANSYVRKPVDFVEFMDAVRQLGAYGLVLNEGPP